MHTVVKGTTVLFVGMTEQAYGNSILREECRDFIGNTLDWYNIVVDMTVFPNGIIFQDLLNGKLYCLEGSGPVEFCGENILK